MIHRVDSTPATLIICGEAIVARSLTLLLQGFRYDARFLPTVEALDALDGAHLLLLTPPMKQNAEYRESSLALLKVKALAAGIPILELVSSWSQASEVGSRIQPEHVVPWPCSTEELFRRVEKALPANTAGPIRLVEQ